MSFDKLDRFKKNVKAVARKSTVLDEPVTGDPEANSNIPQKSSRQQLAIPNLPKNVEDEDPFAEIDSEKNIIILNKADMQKYLGSDVIVEESESIPQIKGATFVKLVERATYEKYADTNFQSDFLYTYRSFTTPKEMLHLLIKRYNMPVPKGLSYGELQEWKQNKQRPIRLRVINVLRHWLEKYWKDFTQDAEMGTKLHEFIVGDLMNTGNQQPADQLLRLYTKKREDPEQDRQIIFTEPPPKPFLPPTKKSSVALGLMDFHPEEIARQLTLIEYNLYKSIKPWEFFNQSWTKKDKEILSPNILNMIKRFNKVSGWVATEIVKTEKLKDRTLVLGKFLEIADKCRSQNNFNALMEILSGLQSSSVFRLRQTWEGLGSKQQVLYEELKELMTRQGNFSKLRKHVKTCNPPLIPYLGVYLTDLTFIEDGNPDFLEGGLINWVKRRRLAAVLKDIQQYQQKPYCLEEVPFVQEYLLKYEPFDEDQCYKLSLMRETRQPDKENKRKSIFAKKDAPKPQPTQTAKGVQAQQQPLVEEEEEEEFELEYRTGYKFYDKDSENNIILEKDKATELDVVIAGTLPKLIERLTYEKHPDTAFVTAFLNTFRTFVTPHEFLDLLIMRYHIPAPVNASEPGVMDRFKKKEIPIQLRTVNVFRQWIEKYFDDFRQDKSLLTKLLEFIDKSMVNGKDTTMQRAGQNLKAQVSNKLDIKEVKVEYVFPSQPPMPIIPTNPDPGLLDYSPEELARQFTLMDFDYLNGIKPLEYLHLHKSLASFFQEEQQEEDPETVKESPHIVAVNYRYTDVRDWVATEIIKREDKVSRAKVIELFIGVAQHCLNLKNFQTLQAIISSLNFDWVQKFKSTWKLVSPAAAAAFVQLSELTSYRDNYRLLREKLASLDYPCIPFLGMYLQDLVGIKEQMPDTIEPGSFVNFAKRFKLSEIISEINYYGQQPFCLEPVSIIQDYLKTLNIYEISEMKAIALQYQQADGDDKVTGSIVDQLMARNEAISKGQPVPEIKLPPPSQPIQPSQSASKVNGNGTTDGQKTPPDSSPRNSVTPDAPTSANLSRTSSSSNVAPSNSSNSSPQNSPRNSLNPPTNNPPAKGGAVGARRPLPSPTTQSNGSDDIDMPKLKTQVVSLLTTDKDFRDEISHILESMKSRQDAKSIDSVLTQQFPGAKVTPWKANDMQGTVYGWPEDINARIVETSSDLFVCPVVDGCEEVDKAALAVYLRVAQLYENMNRFSMGQRRPKVVIANVNVKEDTKSIAQRCGCQIIEQ